MKKRFFIVSDFRQTDTGTYTLAKHVLVNPALVKQENFIDEELLVDLMGDIDVSLLEDNFISKDIECNRGMILSRFFHEKAKTDISGKLDGRLKAVKTKMNYLAGVISGAAAVFVLLAAAATWLAKKAAIQQH